MSRNRIWAALASCLVIALFALPAPAQGPNPPPELVAVIDLEPIGATKGQVTAVSDRLREELLGTHRFKLVDRTEMNKVLDEQAFQQAICTSQECAVKAGKVLGVRKLVTGRLNRVEDDLWLMSAIMVDVETAETLQAASVQLDGSFRVVLADGVGKLASKLGQPAMAMTVSAGAPPSASGSIRVSGIGDDAEVFLNGLTRGSGSKLIASLAPATYDVEVRRAGFHSFRKSVKLAGGAIAEVKPVFATSTIAVFPFVVEGHWREQPNWFGHVMANGAQAKGKMLLTHSAYGTKRLEANLSDETIAKNTWTFFGNPNTEYIATKARELGVDNVLTGKIAPAPGSGKGTYKLYLYNANTGSMQVDSGLWTPGRGAPEVSRALADFLHDKATAK